MNETPSWCFAGSKTRNTVALACVLGVFVAFGTISYGVFGLNAHPTCFAALLPITALAGLVIVLTNRHVGQISTNNITIVLPFGKVLGDSNQKQRHPPRLQHPDSKAG